MAPGKVCFNVPNFPAASGVSRSDEGSGSTRRVYSTKDGSKLIKGDLSLTETAAYTNALANFSGFGATVNSMLDAVKSQGAVRHAAKTLNDAPSDFFAKQYAREDAITAFCESYQQEKDNIDALRTDVSISDLSNPTFAIASGEVQSELNTATQPGGVLYGDERDSIDRAQADLQSAMASAYDAAVGSITQQFNEEHNNIADFLARNQDPLYGQTVDGLKSELAEKYKIFCVPGTGEIRDKYKFRNKVAKSYEQVADQIQSAGANRLKAYVSDTHSTIDLYTNATNFANRLVELLGIRKHEKAQLEQALREQTDMTHTDNRKAVYEIAASADIAWIMTALKWTWIGLLVLYMLVGPFIPDNQWRIWYAWVILICLAGIPWVMQSIAGMLFNLWKTVIWWKENRAPKNVYTEL